MITAVDGNRVALDRTAFYPGGGGQPNDVGTLTAASDETWNVVKVSKQGADVWHELDRAAPPIGTPVQGAIDWARRYQLMRTHTAMHILCGVIFRDYGASVTGGNMEPLKGRMDFEFETMRQEFVREIEEKINLEVAAARELRVRILPREEAFQIPDLIRTKINLNLLKSKDKVNPRVNQSKTPQVVHTYPPVKELIRGRTGIFSFQVD